MSKIISFKEGKKNLLKNRKKTQIPSSQKAISQRETKKSKEHKTRNGNFNCPNCKTFQYTECQKSFRFPAMGSFCLSSQG